MPTKWTVVSIVDGKPKYVRSPNGLGPGWTYDRVEADDIAQMVGGEVVDAEAFVAAVNAGRVRVDAGRVVW